MLVLSRKSDQGLWVGDIYLKFRVHANRVVVFIEAPPEVLILRDELVRKENQERKDGGSCDSQS